MLQGPEPLALITRYLNQPDDPGLQTEVAAFRAASPDNEAYFLEIETIWKRSATAGRLGQVSGADSARQLERKLVGVPVQQIRSFKWLRMAAAVVIVAAAGYWLYQRDAAPELIIRSTAANQIDSVKLADGSLIVLAPNSSLQYPAQFAADRRGVELRSGMAFFEIAKDARRPFSVRMNTAAVSVLGTSFNIDFNKATIELSVKTGRVVFSPFTEGASAVVNAGQALSYRIATRQLTSTRAQNADSWLTRQLVFVDTPLEEVCEQLSAYYGTVIKLEKGQRSGKKLNARFDHLTLDDVLLVLNETYNISIKRVDNEIHLVTP